MANAKHDENGIATKLGILNTDGVTPINIVVNSSTNALKISDGTSDALLASGTLINSYSSSNKNGADGIEGVTNDAYGQSFLNQTTCTLGSCSFYINSLYNETLSGYAYAKVYAHSGTFGTSSVPTGAALAISDAFDVSVLTSNTFSDRTFTFTGSNQITLTAGMKYCVVLYYDQGGQGGTHSIGIGLKTSGANSTVGNAFRFNHGGTWQALSYVVCYSIYTITALTANAKHDENQMSTIMGVSSIDGVTPVAILCDSNGYLLTQST